MNKFKNYLKKIIIEVLQEHRFDYMDSDAYKKIAKEVIKEIEKRNERRPF